MSKEKGKKDEGKTAKGKAHEADASAWGHDPRIKALLKKDPRALTAEEKDLITRQFIARAEVLMEDFVDYFGVSSNLTGTERRRLFGSGVRNNGFIDKAFDIARDNPQFMPPNFDIYMLNYNMRELEDLRQLNLTLQQLQQLVSNAFLVQSDFCYREALRIYNSLDEQRKARVPGAEPLWRALATFFSRSRRQPADEPTVDELERDVKRLIHGKADGEIVIRNETPKVKGGVHEVIDDIHAGRSAFKASVEESEGEGTSRKK